MKNMQLPPDTMRQHDVEYTLTRNLERCESRCTRLSNERRRAQEQLEKVWADIREIRDLVDARDMDTIDAVSRMVDERNRLSLEAAELRIELKGAQDARA
jgi:hypothetical protein